MSLKALPFLTAGESHGQQLTIVMQNVPAGLELSAAAVDEQLRRRQRGYGRGGRQKIEKDRVQFVAGVRHGCTLGSPIAMVIPNLDWTNWVGRMDVARPAEATPKVTKLRPGHADLAGVVKYGHDDVRNVLERASARETAARVAAGAVARVLLEQFGLELRSHTVSIGPIHAITPDWLRSESRGSANPDIADFWARVESSEVRCGDGEAAGRMMAEIQLTRKAGDTLGGVFEVIAYNAPIGLGSYSHWDAKLDGRLGAALLSVPSIKGVEVGDGFAEASRRGSQVHDVIEYDEALGWSRRTNNAGGTEGGVTNGAPLVVRCATKPISTLINPLPSVDLATKEPAPAHVERSDVCVVPAAGVVGEAMVALVLADAFREKFGGDSVAEIRRNYEAYVDTYRPG